MTKPIARDPIYRRRVSDAEIIDTIAGIELAHRIHKRQFSFGSG